MLNPPPSIFNDVIGPVMRGPSSSHCAAAVRIGRMAWDLMDGEIREVLIEFDPQGSLASTHESQGSDMGLFAGFLGWDTTDGRLPDSLNGIHEAGISVEIRINPLKASHPNTYQMTLRNGSESHSMTAISIGGGSIRVVGIDGLKVAMDGDCYETLLYCDSPADRLQAHLERKLKVERILRVGDGARGVVEIKSNHPLEPDMLSNLQTRFAIHRIKKIAPVLPILSRRHIEVPFLTCAGMLEYNHARNLNLGQLAVQYECARGAISEAEVLDRMAGILDIMQDAIQTGLAGTHSTNRILGYQSGKYHDQIENRRLIDAGVLNRIILYTSALMETKSAMGLIVAAPTAGSCGGLPGACFGAAEGLGLARPELMHAMLAGAMIGVFIAAHATFAAEIGGCQAECGAGSGMAAAALVTLAGGSTQQAVSAASMALQNILGMICDPVANRVEVPCLGKNVLAASNALACANMALADFDPVIPLDEVIQTMDEVGKQLPSSLRCTGLGGLSMTRTAQAIENRLAG